MSFSSGGLARRSALAAVGAACFLMVADPAGSAAPLPPASSITAVPASVQRMMERIVPIAPHVWAISAPLSSGAAPLANVMLIEQNDGLVLVDAGKTRGAGLRIVRLIRSVSRKPVKAVIITHWHPDHVLGLGPIVEAWPGAAIISSRRTLDHIRTDDSYRGPPRALAETAERDRARTATLQGYAREFAPKLSDPTLSDEEHRGWADVIGVIDQRIADERGTYLVMPTMTFDGSYRIADRSAPVEARFIGAAHTDGDVIVWLPNQRVVAAGDMVVAPIPYGGSILEWPDTLRALARLRPRTIVPGHGPALQGAAYVDRLIGAMEAFGANARRLAEGPPLTADQVAARVDVARQIEIFAGRDRYLQSRARESFPSYVADAYAELRQRGSSR